ncbi:MAG TPA: TIGR01777 family oxidoreductase [Microthrixaceae bacterium]|nr:TIGR01777 family oxidoreductase [Microthrixaceae bacterium]
MDVAVTGSTGLIGSALVEHLTRGGHRVRRLVRPGSRPVPDDVESDEVEWDPDAGAIDVAALEGIDAVVHLAGEGIADKRWSDAQKRRIRDSRRLGTSLIARTVASLTPRPALLSGSAIGYYGDAGDRLLDETAPAGDDFLAGVVTDWEAAASPAIDAGARVVFLRSGIVLSPDGGVLARQLPFFRFGLGGRSGSGRQYMSWITLDDEVAAIAFLLESPNGSAVFGPVNMVAPNPVTNAEFAKTLGRALHRPTTIIPMIGPRVLFGRELADSLLLGSQRLQPAVLTRAGYEFEHPVLDTALSDLLA